MAYNKTNLLKKMVEIQELTLKKQREHDLYLKEIYHQYIYPKYHISYRTYHTYLGTNAKRELKKMNKQNENNLFANCSHKNKYIKVIRAVINCETTAIFCEDCGKQLTKEKTDCQ